MSKLLISVCFLVLVSATLAVQPTEKFPKFTDPHPEASSRKYRIRDLKDDIVGLLGRLTDKTLKGTLMKLTDALADRLGIEAIVNEHIGAPKIQSLLFSVTEHLDYDVLEKAFRDLRDELKWLLDAFGGEVAGKIFNYKAVTLLLDAYNLYFS